MFVFYLQRLAFLCKGFQKRATFLEKCLKILRLLKAKHTPELAVHFGLGWNHFQEHRPYTFIKYKLEFQQYGL